MLEITNKLYIIICFIKTFALNFCIYYSFINLVKANTSKLKNILEFILFNLIITILYTYLDLKMNSIILLLIMYLIFGCFLGTITKNKIGYSFIVTIISYAIATISLVLSTVVNFGLYKLIYKENPYINLMGIVIFQLAFVFFIFKIKRFRNGLSFMKAKFNKDSVDNIVIYISLAVVLVASLIGSLFQQKYEIVENLFITFVLLGITMYFMIHKTLTMHYKQTQLLRTMEEYKNEIADKDKEIEKLSKEKYNTSKIRHEFYHRQKALEMLVASQYNNENVDENTNQNILGIINNLTSEYSKECERIKELNELDKTDIPEIDSMFRYMQNECAKNNIEFKLKVVGNIHSLINNKISKSRLETLIGDHIKDAINAVNDDNITKKEIFAILGVKDDCYELAIYDTGKEFNIDTLLKLGIKATTTCENKGGSGIGFMTTFETLAETKASLIITEINKDDYYTKCVTIRFDDKKQYIVRSYRAHEIEQLDKENRIIVEKLQNED